MKISDLTTPQIKIISEKEPQWLFDNNLSAMLNVNPHWVAKHYPKIMSEYRADWMMNNYPDLYIKYDTGNTILPQEIESLINTKEKSIDEQCEELLNTVPPEFREYIKKLSNMDGCDYDMSQYLVENVKGWISEFMPLIEAYGKRKELEGLQSLIT